jgi:hypothetical protein
MMEAAHTSETSVDIQLKTRQYIPEDSELQRFTGSYCLHRQGDDSLECVYEFL